MTKNTDTNAVGSGTDRNDDDGCSLFKLVMSVVNYCLAWITGVVAIVLIIIALFIQLVLQILQIVLTMFSITVKNVIRDFFENPIPTLVPILFILAIAVVVIVCILIVSLPIVIPLFLLALLFSPLLIIGILIIIVVIAVGVVVFLVAAVVLVLFVAVILALIFGVVGLPCAWFRLLGTSFNALSQRSNSGDPVGSFIENFFFTAWKYLFPSLPAEFKQYGISKLLFREPCKYYEPRKDSKKYNKEYDKEVWIYINGIATTKDIAETNRDLLFEMFGRPIHLIHNPTDGLLLDLVECFAWKVGIFDTFVTIGNLLYKDPEDILFEKLEEFLPKENVDRVVLIAHSQGTIVTGNTLMRLLEDGGNTVTKQKMKEYMGKKLEVYNFANCAHTMPDTNIRYVENISNGGDLVAWLGHLFHETFPFRSVWIDANGVSLDIGGKSVIERNLWGHLLNTHYLLPMQKNDKYKESKLVKNEMNKHTEKID